MARPLPVGGVNVREAVPEDAERIQSVARETWHAAYDDILGPGAVDDTIDEWYALDRLHAQVDDPEHAFYVAEADGIVGFVHARPDRERPGVWSLDRLYVRPARWGESIGTRLLERVEAEARDAGADRLRLGVLTDNDIGVSFYEARGFGFVEETRDERNDADVSIYEKELE